MSFRRYTKAYLANSALGKTEEEEVGKAEDSANIGRKVGGQRASEERREEGERADKR